MASERQGRDLIERRGLMGEGIGYVHVHLLASSLMTQETELWTTDRRLPAVASAFGAGSPRGG